MNKDYNYLKTKGKSMKKLYAIIILALIICICSCASFETRLFDMIPGADRITNMNLNYIKADSSPWKAKICIDKFCADGSGETLEDALKGLVSIGSNVNNTENYAFLSSYIKIVYFMNTV
jgi:hypothetical protein